MPNRVRVLTVPDADRAELERRARSKGAPARVVERARIVLLAADGLTGAQIAERAGCTEPTVVKWRGQYAERGLAGLEDAPRPGGPRTVLTDEVVCEILAATVTPPPESLRAAGVTHWSSRRLAAWLGHAKGIGVSHDSITVLWRRFCLAPHRTEGFKFSTDPQLEAKVRDVVGLYLAPPDNAVVVCVDEKPQTNASSRSSPARPSAAPASPPSASSSQPSAPSSTAGTTTRGRSPGQKTPTRSSPASSAPRLKQPRLHTTRSALRGAVIGLGRPGFGVGSALSWSGTLAGIDKCLVIFVHPLGVLPVRRYAYAVCSRS